MISVNRSSGGRQMRYFVVFAACLLAAVLFVACGTKNNTNGSPEPVTQKTDKIAGSNVQVSDVVDFYYTYEWTGYNAEYLRYRFYIEDGKRLFFHEARKVKEDYGPASEKDVIAKGTYELTQKEWDQFLDLIKDGSIHDPEESTSTGGKGPWLYLYYQKGDDVKRMAYEFNPYSKVMEFEEFCESLARKG